MYCSKLYLNDSNNLASFSAFIPITTSQDLSLLFLENLHWHTITVVGSLCGVHRTLSHFICESICLLWDLLNVEENETEGSKRKEEELKEVVKELEGEDLVRKRMAAKRVRIMVKEEELEVRRTLSMLGVIPLLVGMLDHDKECVDSQIASLYALLNLGIGNDAVFSFEVLSIMHLEELALLQDLSLAYCLVFIEIFSSIKHVKVIQFSLVQDGFIGFTNKEKEQRFRKVVKHYVGIWCCLLDHVYYDMYWDEKPGWKPIPPQTSADDHPPW